MVGSRAWLGCAAIWLVACGGGDHPADLASEDLSQPIVDLAGAVDSAEAAPDLTPPGVTIAVMPGTITLGVGATLSFSATVMNASDQTVTWAVTEGAGGSITTDGTYTAPAIPGTYHVTATSNADGSKVATATITVKLIVAVTPVTATLNGGQKQSFSAAVTGDANQAVAWTVMEGAGGGTVNAAGMYTAPGTIGVYHVVATSAADPTRSGSAAITVTNTPQIDVQVSPAQQTLDEGEALQLTATVDNTVDQSLTWVVQGGATGGTITAGGLYTAPLHAGTYTVIATSGADSTKTATAVLTIRPASLLGVGGPATLDQGEQKTFGGTLSGVADPTLLWSIQEGAPGGTVANGVYTAPALPGTYHVIVQSSAIPTVLDTITVTVRDVAITMVPGAATLAPGQTRALTATVTGTVNKGVTYSVTGGGAGGSVNAIGIYTAPGGTGVDSVVATAAANSNKKATATLSVSTTIAVAVTPSTATVNHGGKQGFAAVVTGSAQQAVTWSVTGGGFISPFGVYTAPGGDTTATITATAVADGSTVGTATVNVSNAAAQIAVAVSPQSATVKASGTRQLAAAVTGSVNTAVTWSVLEPGGGSVDAAGLYTAPAGNGSFHVVATSAADPTKTGVAAITVSTAGPVSVSISPSSASVPPNGTRGFTATVSGSSHGVTWSVPGSPATGAVDALGNYTAPAVDGVYSVVATALDDASQSAIASVVVTSTIGVAVIPASTTIAAGSTQKFTAVVTGTADQVVTWSIAGAPAGYAIDGNGVLTTPATAGPAPPLTIRATSNTGAVVGTATCNVVDSSLRNVSGTITWGGAIPHRIFIVAYDPNDSAPPLAGTSIAAPGPFTIHGVRKPNSNQLVLRAWADHGNIRYSMGADPAGFVGPFSFDGTADVSGADVTLTPPSPPLASSLVPKIEFVVPGDGGLGLGIGHVGVNGDDAADHYNVYLSTQPNPGPGNQVLTRHIDSAIESGGFFGIANGTTIYVGVSAVNSTGESPVVTQGPFLIGPSGVPGATVTGSVDLGTLPLGGVVDVFFKCNGTTLVGTAVNAAAQVVPFSLSGLPNGRCVEYIIYDRNGDGVSQAGEPDSDGYDFDVAGDVGLPVVAMPDGNARFVISTERIFDGLVEQQRNLTWAVRPGKRLPVTASLLAGPAVAGMAPIDLPAGYHYGGNIELALRQLISASIAVNDSYQLLVGYDDGSSEVLSAQVTAFYSPPTNIVVGAGLTPSFGWTNPALPQTYEWLVAVNRTSDGQRMWDSSVFAGPVGYNFDGTGSPLIGGTPYNFELELRDSLDNMVRVTTPFTP